MSTSAFVLDLNERLERPVFRGLYVHWDGHPLWVGRILERFYNEQQAVDELFALGDLSSIAEIPAHCNAYHRDQGLSWFQSAPMEFRFFDQAVKWAQPLGCAFLYLWLPQKKQVGSREMGPGWLTGWISRHTDGLAVPCNMLPVEEYISRERAAGAAPAITYGYPPPRAFHTTGRG